MLSESSSINDVRIRKCFPLSVVSRRTFRALQSVLNARTAEQISFLVRNEYAETIGRVISCQGISGERFVKFSCQVALAGEG